MATRVAARSEKRGGDVASTGAQAETRIRTNSVHILLVEDHEDTRMLVERLLARCGYDVCAAGTVNAARQLLCNFRFDALLSDIGLPDGDGYDVLAEAKTRQPNTKAIAMSAYSATGDRTRAAEAGFEDYLVKPLDVRRLRRVLECP